MGRRVRGRCKFSVTCASKGHAEVDTSGMKDSHFHPTHPVLLNAAKCIKRHYSG